MKEEDNLYESPISAKSLSTDNDSPIKEKGKKNSLPNKIKEMKHTSEQLYAETLIDIINKTNNKQSNKKNKKKNNNITNNIKEKNMKITLYEYLMRIKKYTNFEFSSLILSLIYIDRLCLEGIELNENNIFKIVLTSIMISIKYNEDTFYQNDFIAKIGGVTIKELNKLEYKFSQILDFNFFVDHEDYNKYEKLFLEINE